MTLANALWYPAIEGYDGAGHSLYAHQLVRHGTIPWTDIETHTPPGYHVIAGSLGLVGDALLGNELLLGQLLNVVIVVTAAFVLYEAVHMLFPDRSWPPLAAASYLCVVPVVPRLAAMFHPDPLSLLAGVTIVWATIRLILAHSVRLRDGIVLGLAIGLGQWTRTPVVVVGIVALAAVALEAVVVVERRRSLLACFAVAGVLAVLVPLPWYAKQYERRGTPFPVNAQEPSTPFFDRRPFGFFVAPRLSEIARHPVRPWFSQHLLPVYYSDLWGDYWGYFLWNGDAVHPKGRLNPFAGGSTAAGAFAKRAQLRADLLAGVIPTALAIVGAVLLLFRSVRDLRQCRRARLRAFVLLSGAAVMLANLYFTVRFPTTDGVELKPSYALLSLPAWALGFAYIVAGVRGWARFRARVLLPLLLVGAVVLVLGADIYGSPLKHVF